MKKTCRICKIEKELINFPKRKDSKDGYRNECKVCHNKARRETYLKNIQHENQIRKKYYQENIVAIKEKKKEHYQKNKDYYFTKNKEYRDAHRQELNEYAKKYRKEHQKEITLKKKEKRHNNEKYYFEIYLRNKINNYLYRYGKIRKNNNVQEILGCSFEDFKNYIESKFKENMSWENRGEWHLDHIIPLSTAKSYEDLIKLNHYSNFQPLWAYENLKKGNKLEV